MKKIAGIAFVLLSVAIMSVSAYVYETATQTVGQTIINVATITLKSSDLGPLEEGQTQTYTKSEVGALGTAISITSDKPTVYLHLNSDIESLATYYSNYTIAVKCLTVPGGLIHSVGDIAAALTLTSPDSAIQLDSAGSWTFDFEITTTALPVTSNQTTTATIIVTAEST